MSGFSIPMGFAQRLDTRDGQIHALLPAGMGDFGWVRSKWWYVSEVLGKDVTFWFPQEEQHRAGALAEMYGAKYGYLPGLTTEWVWNQPGNPQLPGPKDSGAILAVHANRHLENGRHIETWYPDLPFRTPVPNLLKVSYHQEVRQSPYVVVFPCQHGYMEKGGNLLPGMWARLIMEIEDKVAPVLLVGAGNDVPLVEDICEIWCPTIRPTLNAPLSDVLTAIRDAKGMVGAASGLTILSTYMGVATVHGYPRWLAAMPGTWEQEGAWRASRFLDEFTDGNTVDILAGLIAEKQDAPIQSQDFSVAPVDVMPRDAGATEDVR